VTVVVSQLATARSVEVQPRGAQVQERLRSDAQQVVVPCAVHEGTVCPRAPGEQVQESPSTAQRTCAQ
jgi:hypothetical protein